MLTDGYNAVKAGHKDYRYRALLECGHWIKLKDNPTTDRNKYHCRSGLGCGYQLRWVRWTSTRENIEGTNELYEASP